eukprot:1184392-Prorocentrum_minimum.AAC.1
MEESAVYRLVGSGYHNRAVHPLFQAVEERLYGRLVRVVQLAGGYGRLVCRLSDLWRRDIARPLDVNAA